MITSRVIGALGPRPLGGAPGAPGAATPPPEKKIFLFSFRLFHFHFHWEEDISLFVCFSLWSGHWHGGRRLTSYLLHWPAVLHSFETFASFQIFTYILRVNCTKLSDSPLNIWQMYLEQIWSKCVLPVASQPFAFLLNYFLSGLRLPSLNFKGPHYMSS